MAKECKNYERNIRNCNCTYESCTKKGYCCECVVYHRERQELPACFFDEGFEKTYDRTFRNFIKMVKE
ncbi:MAG: DUF6485 family protein, partial [Candidatus Omnitrophica bacterium]|nr:DUF6485 family protein [Candidatus Omnitrophota bacterium]